MDAIFLNACKNNQKAIVQTLLKKGGINLDKRDGLGNTPLYYSCQKGARDIVKILVEAGADVNLANNQSATPLHIVSQSGNKEIVAVLLRPNVLLLRKFDGNRASSALLFQREPLSSRSPLIPNV